MMRLKGFFKGLAWAIGGALGLALLLALVWWLTNLRDVEAQPWPAELQMAPNRLADADNLYQTLRAVPPPRGLAGLHRCGEGQECGDWRQRLPEWARQRSQNEDFGRSCEAVVGRENLRFEEPLPARMEFTTALPSYQLLTHCVFWLHGLALQSLHEGKAPEVLQRLREADRFNRAVQRGSRILIGQMTALGLHRNQLWVLREAAQAYPSMAADLAALALASEPDLRDGLRRWIAGEASVGRTVIDDLSQKPQCTGAGLAMLPAWERWLCPAYSAMLQPEYAKAQFARDWDAVLTQVGAGELDGLPTRIRRLGDVQAPGYWDYWRHFVPTMLTVTTRPAWLGYFDRTADLLMSSQTTTLWLQAHAIGPAERSAWVTSRLKGELAQRLTITPSGDWELRLWNSKDTRELPQRWPAIRS